MNRTPLVALGSAVLILGTLTPVAAHADPVTIAGTVTAGGSGVGGVEVDFGTQTTSTAADGTFSLALDTSSVPAGWITIGGTARSGTFQSGSGSTYATAVVGAGGVEAPAAGLVQPISPSALAGLPALSVALQPAGSISGSDPSLARAYISLFDPNGDDAGASTQATAAGAYSFSGVAPGTYRVRADSPTGPGSVSSLVAVSAGQNTVSSPRLPAAATLAGTVSVAHRAPKAHVPVYVTDTGSERGGITATSGAYKLSGLLAGTYTARYGTYGTNSTMAAGAWVPKTITAGLRAGTTTTKNVDLAVGGTIALSITKPSGAKNVLLSVRKGSTTVAQRSLTFGKASTVTTRATGLATGRYSVAVASSTGRMAETTVGVVAKRTTSLRVSSYPRKALTLSGTAPGLTSGTLVVVPKDSGDGFVRTAPIRANGSYSLTGLVPNTYSVWAYNKTNSSFPGVTTVLNGSRALTVRIRASGQVKGTFTLDGLPVGDAQVDLVRPTGVYDWIDVNSDGTFDATLPAGTYRIRELYASDTVPVPSPYWLAPSSGTFTVTSGHSTDLGAVALEVHGG